MIYTVTEPAPQHTRKLSRVIIKPGYLKYIVCNNIILTDFTRKCLVPPAKPSTYSFNALSIPNQHIFTCLSVLSKPTSYKQACIHPGWRKAMYAEIQALKQNQT